MHPDQLDGPARVRPVEPVPTDGVDWAYDTPMAAPDRGSEPLPRDLATISPAMARRREEATPLVVRARTTAELSVPQPSAWERAGYLIFVGGIGSLATAGATLVVSAAWFLLL